MPAPIPPAPGLTDPQQTGTSREDWLYFKSPEYTELPLPEKLSKFNSVARRSNTYATMPWAEREKLRTKILGVNSTLDVFKHEAFPALETVDQNDLSQLRPGVYNMGGPRH